MDSEDLHEPDSSYHQAMKEQELVKKFKAELSAKAKDLVDEYFPYKIQHLSAEGYLELEKVITIDTSTLALKIVTIIYDDEG